MKKWLLILTAFCVLCAGGMQTYAYSEGVLEYRIEDETVVITGCQKDAQGEVDIPEELLGYPVVRIEAAAFSKCTGVTSISVPSAVTDIGEEALYGCTALQSVILPEGLLSLDVRACAGCTQLEQISLPDGLTGLGEAAFQNCSSLSEIRLPEGVPVLETRLIAGCSSLTQIELAQQTRQIGARFAQDCAALTELTIPSAVTKIGDSAFQGCTALTDVYFLGNAPEVGANCFEKDTTILHYCEGAEGWTQPEWNGYQTQADIEPELTGITLSQDSVELIVGDSVTLTASPEPEYASLGELSWSSSAPNIVRVEDGVLTAKTAGKATVTARSGSVSAQCAVIVTEPDQPQSIVLSQTELMMYVGDTAKLTAEILPEDAELTWTSSDTEIASVRDGLVTAVGGGTAYITASTGEAEAVCTVTVGLSTPELLSVQSTCTEVTICWNPVEGAQTYQILRRTDGDWEPLADTDGTVYADTSGVYDTEYRYTVRACDGDILGEYDPEGVTGRRVIGQPVLSAADSVDDKTIRIRWEPVTNAEKYRLYRKTESSGWKKVVEFTGTEYEDTGLTCGTEYIYTVRALWKDKISTYDKAGVSVIPVPSAPVLKSTGCSVGMVRLRWEAVPRVTGYRVYRKTDDTGWQRITTVSSGTLSCQDTTAEDGVIYTYTIRAYRKVGSENILGNYDTEGVRGYTRPRTPELVSATAQKAGNRICWNAVTAADGYDIYRKTDGSWKRIASVSGTRTAYLDTKAQAGTTCHYTVRAYLCIDGRKIRSSYESGLTVTTAS